jgi:hypothetical protein
MIAPVTLGVDLRDRAVADIRRWFAILPFRRIPSTSPDEGRWSRRSC